MQDYIYSVIAFLAMAIHLIINYNQRSGRQTETARAVREYRGFLKSVFAYYITDASWGVLAGLGWTKALYADTVLYFIAISVSVLAWCRFVIVYLDLGRLSARTLSWFGYVLLAMYVALLLANGFNDCLFHFDGQGNYIAGSLRCLVFYPLVALNVLTAVCVFVKAGGNSGALRRRNMMVFLFCLTMAVSITLQILWPLWPYYALGCLIGNCFFHVFVIEDERDELRRAVIEREQAAKHMAELEEALARARAAEKARSQFFSIVSHDIRTPLNAILGYSELLQYGVKSEEERKEALESIRASGTTLLQLVNDVLDLAKMDSGKMTLQPQSVRLERLTDEVFATFRLAASITGVELVNRTADVPTVMLVGHRFRQILFNLVGNAVKFTKRGSITVAASYSDENLEVSVSDTGCGIPADMLTRILDPFVQVLDPSHAADRAGGTGLGLSICRSLAKVMGGEIAVESELGKGSTFRVRIPGVAVGEEDAAPAAEAAPAAAEHIPERALVVDDSAVNRAVLTALMRRAGVGAVDHSCDGAEALAALDAAETAGRPYDFVMTDFWMPNMNGLEFIERLRADQRFRGLPVFAVTADTEVQQDPRSGLFTGILFKPMTYDKLLAAFG